MKKEHRLKSFQDVGDIIIKAEKLAQYPIWRVYKNGDDFIFYDRMTERFDGLTRDQVIYKLFEMKT